MIEAINKLKFINEYSVKKGGRLNEWNDYPDISNWIEIGILDGSYEKYYLFGDPNITNEDFDKISFRDCDYPKPNYIDKFKNAHSCLNTKQDKSGRCCSLGEIPSYLKKYLRIYPEYKNTIYEWMYFGKPQEVSEKRMQKHQELMNKCYIVGNELILHHTSNVKITDGYIKRGTPNLYTPRDFNGICFWASPKSGPDQSNGGRYVYYCKIPLNKAYDCENNIENITNTYELHQKYPYELRTWAAGKGYAVTCVTDVITPIWFVIDRESKKCYDDKWNEIEKPNIETIYG